MRFPGDADSKESAHNVSLIPGLEDPLEEGMAAHSSILRWRIPWAEELGGFTAHRVAQSWTRLK